MFLIGVVVFLAWLLSSKTVQRMAPFESFLAVGVAAAATLTLFEFGRLS